MKIFEFKFLKIQIFLSFRKRFSHLILFAEDLWFEFRWFDEILIVLLDSKFDMIFHNWNKLLNFFFKGLEFLILPFWRYFFNSIKLFFLQFQLFQGLRKLIQIFSRGIFLDRLIQKRIISWKILSKCDFINHIGEFIFSFSYQILITILLYFFLWLL